MEQSKILVVSLDWIREARLAHSGAFGQGCSPGDVAIAQGELGVDLPADYRAFLLEFGWIDLPDVQVNGLGEGVPAYLDLVAEARSEREIFEPHIPAHLLPISNDGSGSHYCLDLSAPSMPQFAPVVYFSHDSPRGSHQTPEPVAASFSAWLAAIDAP